MTTAPQTDTDNPYATVDHLLEEAAKATFEKQLDQAVARASSAFWRVLAKEFPHCTSGDFPPLANDDFEKAVRRAAIIWVALNTPKS